MGNHLLLASRSHSQGLHPPLLLLLLQQPAKDPQTQGVARMVPLIQATWQAAMPSTQWRVQGMARTMRLAAAAGEGLVERPVAHSRAPGPSYQT